VRGGLTLVGVSPANYKSQTLHPGSSSIHSSLPSLQHHELFPRKSSSPLNLPPLSIYILLYINILSDHSRLSSRSSLQPPLLTKPSTTLKGTVLTIPSSCMTPSEMDLRPHSNTSTPTTHPSPLSVSLPPHEPPIPYHIATYYNSSPYLYFR